MRNGILGLLVLVAVIGPATAQTSSGPYLPSAAKPANDAGWHSLPTSADPALPPAADQDATCAPCPDASVWETAPANAGRTWFRTDYLLWWVKNTPLPVPLVTTGDPTVGFPLVNTAGALGAPGTRVLLGGSPIDLGTFSGTRLTLGSWLDADRTVGIEGSGFALENRVSRFSAGSDATGNPPLYFPAFNVVTGGERGLPIADPLRLFAGDVFVGSSLQLWGTEVNGIFCLVRRPNLEFSLLAGFRYLDLHESLQIENVTQDLLFLNTQVASDRFDTRNQFYGGQLGARLSWQVDGLSLDVTGKVALGDTQQVVNVQGTIADAALPGGIAPLPGIFLGGIFAQPSNIGRLIRNEFTVLPSVEVKLGYQITPWLRASAGYDFLYWNQVVRPGDQIDHFVNPSQNAVLGAGVLTGPAAPAPLFNRSDFWAQGVSFGLEFRY